MTRLTTAPFSTDSPEERTTTPPSPHGGRSGTTAHIIPDPLFAHEAHLLMENHANDTMRCSDCKGYTVHAAVIGIKGVFCSCPFDASHP